MCFHFFPFHFKCSKLRRRQTELTIHGIWSIAFRVFGGFEIEHGKGFQWQRKELGFFVPHSLTCIWGNFCNSALLLIYFTSECFSWVFWSLGIVRAVATWNIFCLPFCFLFLSFGIYILIIPPAPNRNVGKLQSHLQVFRDGSLWKSGWIDRKIVNFISIKTFK